MNSNPNNFGVNPYMMGGPQYAVQPQARMTQPLTVEQIKLLRNQTPAFTLDVSDEDMLRSRCTHKTLDGKFATVLNNDPEGTVTCSICGAKFSLMEVAKESAEEAVRIIIDLLQSIKTYYVDMPDSVAIQFFQMIPFIEKIPKLYEIALNNFNKYDGAGMGNQSPNMYGFNMLGAITSPMAYQMGGMPMSPGMPMGGYPMQQPMMGGYPIQPGQQMPQQMGMGNPFGGYQMPYNNMQPGAQQMQPGQPVQQGTNPNGPAVADPACVVQQKVFNV